MVRSVFKHALHYQTYACAQGLQLQVWSSDTKASPYLHLHNPIIISMLCSRWIVTCHDLTTHLWSMLKYRKSGWIGTAGWIGTPTKKVLQISTFPNLKIIWTVLFIKIEIWRTFWWVFVFTLPFLFTLIYVAVSSYNFTMIVLAIVVKLIVAGILAEHWLQGHTYCSSKWVAETLILLCSWMLVHPSQGKINGIHYMYLFITFLLSGPMVFESLPHLKTASSRDCLSPPGSVALLGDS